MTITASRTIRTPRYDGDMQDKLRAVLLSFGERDINLSIDDLVGKTGLSYSQIYQTLYRLQRLGELEIIRDQSDSDGGRPRITGVRLARMEPLPAVEQRATMATTLKASEKDLSTVSTSVPHVISYLNQKLAIEKARAEILKVNINPDDVISFDLNPLGEEAIYLLSKVQEIIEENRTLSNDLQAEKRNAAYYKERMGAATFDDSGT